MKRLLQNNQWFAVAPINKKSLDGRVISDTIAKQVVKNFNRFDFIPYIAIGHDGIWGDGAEARMGSISNVRYNKKEELLEVMPFNLDNQLITDIEAGKYPHVSIELQGVAPEKESDDDDENPSWEYMFSGFAVLGRVPPAFDGMKTVEFNAKNTNNKVFIFEIERQGGLEMNDNLETVEGVSKVTETQTNTAEKSTKETKQETLFEVQSTPEVKKEAKKKEEKSNYVADPSLIKDKQIQTFEQIKIENELIKQENELYKKKMAEKDSELNNCVTIIEQYKEKLSQITFRNFYEEQVRKGIIVNDDLGLFDIEKPNIFESKLYEHWRASDEQGRETIKANFSYRTSKIKDTKGIGFEPEKKDVLKTRDEMIADLAYELASKEGVKVTSENISKYQRLAISQLSK